MKNKKQPTGDNGIKKKRSRGRSFVRFLKSDNFHRILGFSFILASVYLFLSFTSYLIDWFNQEAHDILNGSTFHQLLFDHDTQVNNWGGRLGTALSQKFIKNWFGVASYFILLYFFIAGFYMLFKVTIFSMWKTFRTSFLGLIFFSLAFGFIFMDHSRLKILGGVFGKEMSLWLTGLVGTVGTVFILLFVLFIFVLITFRFKRNKPRKSQKKPPPPKEKGTNTDPRKEDKYNTVEFSVSEDEDLKDVPTGNDIKKNDPENHPAIEEEMPEDDIELTVEKRKEESTGDPKDHKTLDTHFDPTLELSNYTYPALELLSDYNQDSGSVTNEELQRNKNRIVETLQNYNIQIEKIKATIGPTVTLYEIVPAPGIRISKIKNLEDDIALSLSAFGIRIIAPIPGKGTIGIEVPNQQSEIVSIKSILTSEKYQNTTYELPFGLGKTISNESYIADLTRLPHILMAGATGQGKSVGLNAIITSLLYKKHPSQLKFILVDPKKVELTLYSKIERHFLAKLPDSEEAIITDTRKVVRTLNSLGIEMDNRYELLKDAQVRNIKEYNKKFVARKLNPEEGHRYLPYLILVVDEFADLIMTAGKEIENPLTRLAQLARAVGIHLIIATQRPSVNIITGTIKANFPARIAYRVISKVDSRTILDTGGADQLIGRGDMLLATGSDVIRLQCAFMDTDEVERVTDFIGSQRAYPDAYHLPEYADEETEGVGEFDPSDRDELFEDAARVIVQNQQGSTSLLQRRLKLGYNRAGRIIDQLEAAGIVGPFEGSKAREVLISDEYALEQFLNEMN